MEGAAALKRYLVLENAKVFEGKAFGANKDVIAEVVFTTAMTGYTETLTDKSYAGQAVVQTFPLIGNYGMATEDFEGDEPKLAAYIVREWCQKPSNFRSEFDIDTFLKKHNIPGICGIDTRELTRIIREKGTLSGMITDSLDKVSMQDIKSYRLVNPVSKVSTKKAYLSKGTTSDFVVAMLDFGLKKNIVRSLNMRGCDVWVLPHNTAAEEIITLNPDGLFLSNGPGNPKDNKEAIKNIAALMERKYPTMGICLGHQLLALAHGFQTTKLKYGHRGANQPVMHMPGKMVYISSQNHGYAVVGESVDTNVAEQLFVNANDGTNEGLIYKNLPVISVQFHPESCAGPLDTMFLFDTFVKMMKGGRYAT